MKKKGSMELSVNSIVILVIAVVMMGLILGFIRSKFTDISGGFIVDESKALEASASDPITLSRLNVAVNGVKKTGLNVNFYNTATGDILSTQPLFECQNSNVKISSEYYIKTATTSAMTEYTGNIKLTNSVAKNTYLCQVCFLSNYRSVDPGDLGKDCSNLAPANGGNPAVTAVTKEFNLIVQ